MALLYLSSFLYFVCACISSVHAEEPFGHECSRFVYEYKLMERLLKLEMDMTSMKGRLSQAENQKLKTTETVALKVGLLGDISVQNGETIKFDRILVNTGNSYNFTEGVFVAPVSGVYIFSANVCLDDKQWVTVQMLHNGLKIGFFFTGDTEWEACGSYMATQIVEAGDRVWLEKAGGNSNLLHEMYGWNSFTANLIATT